MKSRIVEQHLKSLLIGPKINHDTLCQSIMIHQIVVVVDSRLMGYVVVAGRPHGGDEEAGLSVLDGFPIAIPIGKDLGNADAIAANGVIPAVS